MKLIKKLIINSYAIGALCFAGSAFAAPTAQQLEMFKSLPKSQQESLMKQYGGSNSAVPAPTPVEQEVVSEPVIAEREINQDVAQSEQVEEAKKATDEADLKEQQVTTKVEAVKPFGYDLFAGSPSTFAPLANAPVPADYIVGPGDTLNVQVYGAENSAYALQLDREGNIQLPKVGPVQLSGLSFSKASKVIEKEIKRASIGVEVSVTAGALRSIRVFVLGDVHKPGAYVVSGLSTMSNALLSSGGVKTIGSLRDIQLKRNGKVISNLDLYDFLLKGDMRQDVSLLDGDVLFVPTVKKTVTVAGQVRRPAVYELKNERTIKEILELAGGFKQSASPADSKLERIRSDGYREVKDVNLADNKVLRQRIRNGDTLRVLKTVDEFKDIVLVKGSLSRPGEYQWQPGLRIADLFMGNAKDVFLPQTDLEHVFIKREVGFERSAEILMVDLKQALRSASSLENVLLNARDEILILNNDQNRSEVLATWVKILKRQAKSRQLPKIVKVFGSVQYPGEYPLVSGMTVEDLLSVAGGAKITALPQGLLRQESQFNRKVSVKQIDFNQQTKAQSVAAMDELIVLDELSNEDINQRILDLNERLKFQATAEYPAQIVNVQGFVRFPGEYPLTRGMTAQNLIQLAGGLVESAYEVEGEIVSRVVDPETRKLSVSGKTVQLNSETLSSYKLQTMDSVIVKQKPDWRESQMVKLSGEVKFPGTYVLNENETLAQLIERAGGFTADAFIEGTFLRRAKLIEQQTAELEKMRMQLEASLAQNAAGLETTNPAAAQYLNNVLKEANEAKATGRVSLVNRGGDIMSSMASMILKGGDSVYIPDVPQTVSVIGEVFASQTFSYNPEVDAQEYLQMAGGENALADIERAYIVKASGQVQPLQQSGFFYAMNEQAVDQGDVIVVPMDPDQFKELKEWKEISAIASQIVLAIASIKTIGVF